jgi:hypothetical protein
MKRTWIVAVLGVLALAFAVQPTVPQQPAAETEARMLEEVAGVHDSLDRLVGMLTELLDNQQVDLVLKRIDLKQRRLAPLERDLRSMEESLAGRKMEVRELRQMLEETEDRIQDQVREGTDRPDSEDRLMARQIERQTRFSTGVRAGWRTSWPTSGASWRSSTTCSATCSTASRQLHAPTVASGRRVVQTSRTVEPVVLRPSRSRCARSASRSR